MKQKGPELRSGPFCYNPPMSSKKFLIVTLVIIFVAGNQFVVKDINSDVEVPKTIVDEAGDYFLPEETVTHSDLSTGYLVTKVIDGDTIEINIYGQTRKVRYIGIDTPETINSAQTAGCFATEATLRNKQLVEGQRVSLVKDISETDKYGRLLRYVYVGAELVNMMLIEEGFAKVATYPPDVKITQSFLAAEKIARENKVGLWGEVCN